MAYTAVFMLGMMLIVGLVADVGSMVYQRNRMQIAADAAALGGTQALEGGSPRAKEAAQELAARNGFAIEAAEVDVQDDSRVTVTIDRPVPGLVDRLLALTSAQRVGAQATAIRQETETRQGVRPWGIPEQDFDPGREYVLKQGAGNATRGNFMPLALDGGGAQAYATAVRQGTTTTVRTGEWVATEPGNMAGPTVSAVDALIGDDRTAYDEAIADPGRTPRVVSVLLLTAESVSGVTGRSQVQVGGFARFYLTYTTSRGEVYGRFMERLDAAEVAGTRRDYRVRLIAGPGD